MKEFVFQDLGDGTMTIREKNTIGPSGVETLVPDGDTSHIDALEDVRSIIDDYYGESIDNLCDDDEKVVIERVVFQSEALPHIEYTVVDDI